MQEAVVVRDQGENICAQETISARFVILIAHVRLSLLNLGSFFDWLVRNLLKLIAVRN